MKLRTLPPNKKQISLNNNGSPPGNDRPYPQQVGGPAGKFDKLCRLGGFFFDKSHQLRGVGGFFCCLGFCREFRDPTTHEKTRLPDYLVLKYIIRNLFFRKTAMKTASQNLRSGIFTPKKNLKKICQIRKKKGNMFFLFSRLQPIHFQAHLDGTVRITRQLAAFGYK